MSPNEFKPIPAETKAKDHPQPRKSIVSNWKERKSVVFVKGDRPLAVASVIKSDKDHFVLQYTTGDSVALPVSHRTSLYDVDPTQWQMRLRDEPENVIAELYELGLCSWNRIDYLLKSLKFSPSDTGSSFAERKSKVKRKIIEDAKNALDEKPKTELTQDASADTKKILKVPSWLKEFVLHLAHDKTASLPDQYWAMQAARKKRWLKEEEFVDELNDVLQNAARSIDSLLLPNITRKKDVNGLAAAVRRDLAEASFVSNTVLQTCLKTADSQSHELTMLADWAWTQLVSRAGVDILVLLQAAAASAPRWTISTLWQSTLSRLSMSPDSRSFKYWQLLLSLLTDATHGKRVFIPALGQAVIEHAKQDVFGANFALMRFLTDRDVPASLATALGVEVSGYEPLRDLLIRAVGREEDKKLDGAFRSLLVALIPQEVESRGRQDRTMLEKVASPGMASSKTHIMADVVREYIHETSKLDRSFEWASFGLAAFLDGCARADTQYGKDDELTAVWLRLISVTSLPSLAQAQQKLRGDIQAPLQAELERTHNETARVQAEAEGFRREVKRLSATVGNVDNPMAAKVAWALDLISIIDDLDRQQAQSSALVSFASRMIKLLLATLKKHNVNALKFEPGDTVTQEKWHSAPSEFRVFEDSANAEVLTVIQRGYVLEDVAGHSEILRPALLDQPYT